MTPAQKRILIFSTAYDPFIGGAEVALKEITKRITDMSFVMITARLRKDLPVRETIGAIDVHRIGRGNGFDKYRLILNGPAYAERLGAYDTVWAMMASYAGFAALRYKKRRPQVPYLLTLQEGDSRFDIYKHVWWCWWYFKQIFHRADRIQAISSYLAAWAKTLGATCPIGVVPNGVAVERFAAPTQSDVRTLLALPTAVRVVVTVSRLVPKNGVSALVSAMVFLPGDVHLVIVGSGQEEHRISSFIREKKLSDRVHLVGEVMNDHLPQYLHRADVFCRPSRTEGLGIAFLEAMAAGVPIVAPPVGGIPEFLTDGDTGLFCRVDDPKDIAEKIERILTDAPLRERLQKNGLLLVKEKYQWDFIAQKMKHLL